MTSDWTFWIETIRAAADRADSERSDASLPIDQVVASVRKQADSHFRGRPLIDGLDLHRPVPLEAAASFLDGTASPMDLQSMASRLRVDDEFLLELIVASTPADAIGDASDALIDRITAIGPDSSASTPPDSRKQKFEPELLSETPPVDVRMHDLEISAVRSDRVKRRFRSPVAFAVLAASLAFTVIGWTAMQFIRGDSNATQAVQNREGSRSDDSGADGPMEKDFPKSNPTNQGGQKPGKAPEERLVDRLTPKRGNADPSGPSEVAAPGSNPNGPTGDAVAQVEGMQGESIPDQGMRGDESNAPSESIARDDSVSRDVQDDNSPPGSLEDRPDGLPNPSSIAESNGARKSPEPRPTTLMWKNLHGILAFTQVEDDWSRTSSPFAEVQVNELESSALPSDRAASVQWSGVMEKQSMTLARSEVTPLSSPAGRRPADPFEWVFQTLAGSRAEADWGPLVGADMAPDASLQVDPSNSFKWVLAANSLALVKPSNVLHLRYGACAFDAVAGNRLPDLSIPGHSVFVKGECVKPGQLVVARQLDGLSLLIDQGQFDLDGKIYGPGQYAVSVEANSKRARIDRNGKRLAAPRWVDQPVQRIELPNAVLGQLRSSRDLDRELMNQWRGLSSQRKPPADVALLADWLVSTQPDRISKWMAVDMPVVRRAAMNRLATIGPKDARHALLWQGMRRSTNDPVLYQNMRQVFACAWQSRLPNATEADTLLRLWQTRTPRSQYSADYLLRRFYGEGPSMASARDARVRRRAIAEWRRRMQQAANGQ